MKTIIYASNNFQNLLCLEAVNEWLKGEQPEKEEAFGGLIRLKRNVKSVTATYAHGADTILDFSKPIKEENKNQLKLEL